MIKKTLTELWIQDGFNLKKEAINMIVAPVGSGKTYFIFNELLKHKSNLRNILYLVDTNNLKEAIVKDKEYLENAMIYENDIVKNFRNILSSDNKITVMTYAKFGMLLKEDENIYDSIDMFICDEAHNLIKYANKFDNNLDEDNKIYTNTIIKLKELSKDKDVVFLTATHKSIKKCIELSDTGIYTFDYSKDTRIKRLSEHNVIYFNNYKNLATLFKNFNGILNGEKALIYTDRISTVTEIVEELSNIRLKSWSTGYEKQIKAIGLWSTNNSSNEMTEEQILCRKSIIETGMIPDDIDVIIINSAYETGINIKDSRIETVVVNSVDLDTQIQARGRVRKDIANLYLKSKSKENEIKITVSDKWIDRALTKDDKKLLCIELNLVNQNGRALSWTSVKKILEYSGYRVTDTQIRLNRENRKQTRVSIINE